MNKIMLTCLQATKLTTQRSFRNLSVTEKLQLKMHHSVCHACRKFDSQNTYIDHAVKNYFHIVEKNSELRLSDERKKNISEVIDSSLH
jgi:heterodisulfide reductase subunit B